MQEIRYCQAASVNNQWCYFVKTPMPTRGYTTFVFCSVGLYARISGTTCISIAPIVTEPPNCSHQIYLTGVQFDAWNMGFVLILQQQIAYASHTNPGRDG
ncbi:MAG: hypothetical protein KAV99_05405 [Candidatus Latescibacteria bacterium]|nr:hypothetical protein [Candidatus Latescibacterota bacterium]